MAFSTMPPVVPFMGLGLTCFLTRLMPSTTRWESSLRSATVPRLPLSRPVSTITSSPLRILFMARTLENFRSQGHDLHEALATQFTRHGAEDAGANGLQLVVEQHCRIAVELDERTVATANALGGTNHHGTVNFAFFDATTRSSLFDADLDDVAHAGIATLGTTQHLDAQDGLRAGIVGNV